jgi:hypothetical protein
MISETTSWTSGWTSRGKVNNTSHLCTLNSFASETLRLKAVCFSCPKEWGLKQLSWLLPSAFGSGVTISSDVISKEEKGKVVGYSSTSARAS